MCESTYFLCESFMYLYIIHYNNYQINYSSNKNVVQALGGERSAFKGTKSWAVVKHGNVLLPFVVGGTINSINK